MSGHESAHRSHCQNCGEPLTGPYCSRCGQHDVDYHRSVGPIIEDALEGLLHFDGKFFKSVLYIFTRPGFLTREFIAGRRTRYANPLRFYIFASFVFFAVSALTHHNDTPAEAAAAKAEAAKDVKAAEDELKAEDRGAPAAKGAPGEAAGVAKPAPEVPRALNGTSRNPTVQKFLNITGNIDQHALGVELVHLMPMMLFFCLPVLALLLKAAFLRSGRFYVEHLIFALHIQAFVFLAMLASQAATFLAGLVGNTTKGLTAAVFFFGSVWIVYRAFRNLYGPGAKWIRLKFLGVGAAYLAFLLVALLALLGISAYVVSRGS